MCRGEIFLSPEFGTKFQREVGLPVFWSIPELPYNTLQENRRYSFYDKKEFDSFSRFDNTDL